MNRNRIHLRGFTLTEVVMTICILSVIMLGLQSAMLLAAKANPNRAGVNMSTVTAAQALDILSADLSSATAITSMTATSVTFTVPDRNNDASPETINYTWSGTAGSNLTRSVNGRTAATVAGSVNEFALIYDKRSSKLATSYTESGEQVFFNSDTNPASQSDIAVSDGLAIGQVFRPTLPGSATSWRITRILIKARASGFNTGETRVQVRPVNASLVPTSTVTDYTKMLESTMGYSYGFQTVSFANAAGFAPGTGASVLFIWTSGNEACEIRGYNNVAIANAARAWSSDNGWTWYSFTNYGLIMYVYGTYTMQNPDVYQYNLTGVRCTIRCGADTASRLKTTIRTLYEPVVAGP